MSIRVKKHLVLIGILATFIIIYWLICSSSREFTFPNLDFNDKEYKRFLEAKRLDSEIKYVGNIPLLETFKIKNTSSFFNEIKSVANKKCTSRPELLDLEISNAHYQAMHAKEGPDSTVFYLYGSYLDTRFQVPVIKTLIISEKHLNLNVSNLEERKPNYCQIWYPNIRRPAIAEVNNIQYVWNEVAGIKGSYHPYLLTCDLPRINKTKIGPISQNEVPESVSIVQSQCEKATNLLLVNYKVPTEKKEFGVCVKGLDLPTKDMSVRMINWIEMLRILGVGGIHFHRFDVHPKTQKVLDYYEESGFITVKPFSLPGFQPDFPIMRDQYLYQRSHLIKKRRQELIPYNDCFMTEMYTYKHIAILDVDEVILPLHFSNWTELVKELDTRHSNSRNYCFQMMAFVDRIVNGSTVLATAPDISKQVPDYPYMMNKLNFELRTVCNEGGHRNVKCFYDTEDVIIAHNHYPTKCKNNKYCHVVVKNSTAYVHHHKDSCQKERHKETLLPKPFGHDSSLLKYKDQLIHNSNKVILQLGL